MYRWQIQFLVCIVAFVSIQQCSTVPKAPLKISVYYDGWCTKCKYFLLKQLYPTYLAVNERDIYVEVELIPYGSIMNQTQNPDGSWKLECNTYPQRACYYNKVHACIIRRAMEQSWIPLNFINCLWETNSHSSPLTCATETCYYTNDGIELSNCVNSVDGEELLLEYGRMTAALGTVIADQPIVTYDGVYDESEQQLSLTNLLSMICKKTNGAPKECTKPRANRTSVTENFDSGERYPETRRCH